MQWGFREVSGANRRRQTLQQTIIIYTLLHLYIHAIHISPMTVLLYYYNTYIPKISITLVCAFAVVKMKFLRFSDIIGFNGGPDGRARRLYAVRNSRQ